MKRLIPSILLLCMCVFLSACGCEECSSTGKIDCAVCSNGYIYCEECSSGIEREKCDECNGRGELEVDCHKCDGVGFYMNPITWEKFDCSYCYNGKFMFNDLCDKCLGDKFLEKECSVCKGNYKEQCISCDNGYLPCPTCATEQ